MTNLVDCPASVFSVPHPPQPDLAAIKSRQQATWSAGDFAMVGTTLQIVGETLCEAVDLRAGERVLDVAAGNGNASLAAARRFALVTSSDYVPALLHKARRRARAENLALEVRVADAEALPFAAASFDVVLSTFGVMFAPDQPQAARELLRVCRPGGRIGLTNWTPDGFIGRLFKVIGKHVTPAPGLASPALWGTELRVRELMGSHARQIEIRAREFLFRYRSAQHWIDFFRTFYGPVHQAFAALENGGREALERDLHALLKEFDRGRGAGLVVPGEYAEVVVTRA